MATYLIPVGDEDVDRMDAMCQVFNPFSLELLDEYTNKISAKTFLDVGCGNGGLTRVYARNHPEVKCRGIDASPEQLEVAKRNLPANLEVEVGDLLTLELTETFDIVHTRFVLTHFKNPITAAERLLKFVRPGGVLIMLEADGGAVNFSKEHRAAQAWVKAFTTQHILQGSSLHTGASLADYFSHIKEGNQLTCRTRQCIGKFDTPGKKLTMSEGVRFCVNILSHTKIPDDLNPLLSFGYRGPDWIEESEALIQDPDFYFEMNPLAIILSK